jgi:putative acetyltransferase
MQIRRFAPADATQIAQLFHDTVRTVNIGDYSPAQVAAWAPDDLYFRDWVTRCSSCITYVADDTSTIAGFGELEVEPFAAGNLEHSGQTGAGHIGCFYCHRDYQRCGVGRQIYTAIETQARALGIHKLRTEASITARPFFERMGFAIVRSQVVPCRGQMFTNYVMEKLI